MHSFYFAQNFHYIMLFLGLFVGIPFVGQAVEFSGCILYVKTSTCIVGDTLRPYRLLLSDIINVHTLFKVWRVASKDVASQIHPLALRLTHVLYCNRAVLFLDVLLYFEKLSYLLICKICRAKRLGITCVNPPSARYNSLSVPALWKTNWS